jgi:subtilisin
VTNTTWSVRNLIPVALMTLLALGAGAAQAQHRVSRELVARASREGAVRIIVQLDVPTRPEGRLLAPRSRLRQRERIASAQEGLRAELAGTAYRTARRFRSIAFTALEVGPRALARLERSARVLAVQEDRLHRPTLNVSAPLVEADQAAAMGSDGSGQTVVVIDTGVDANHPNLVGKIVGEACFAAGDPFLSGDCPNGEIFDDGEGSSEYCDYSAECFHGTHVAGIAIGAGVSYPGVAPGATLIPILAFSEFTGSDCDPDPSPCTMSYVSDQIAALEYVFDTLRPLHTIASVNMSLGGTSYTSQAACDAANAATKAAIDNLRSAGIATVIAAGNDGYVSAINEPGCISSAVSVSATDDGDGIPNFSNAADFLSLWAPGVGIRAPLSGSTGFIDASGTSMAAPHVAGAWANLRQAAPSASVDEILTALQDTGLPIPDVYADTSRIRIAQARIALLPECSNGLDDDADGLIDPDDPGCDDADDASEKAPNLACDDGADNDGDGFVDFPEDPGCFHPSADHEDPRCQDGVDNDGDGGIDFDGGASVNGGVPIAEADLGCVASWGAAEARGCGLGVELALLMPLLSWLLGRRRCRVGS